MTAPLFGADPVAAEPRSADRRRTELQAARLARGVHPLSAVAGYQIRLHDEAAPADDRAAPGRRCGSCRFRVLVDHHGSSKRYPKCVQTDGAAADQVARWGPPRVSHSAASDVRGWWPACDRHDYGDPGLSPDAARWVPGEVQP